MTDTETRTAGTVADASQPSAANPQIDDAQHESREAVELRTMEHTQSQETGPSTPAKDAAPVEGDAPASPKGKEKDLINASAPAAPTLAAQTNAPASDSLEIDRSDPPIAADPAADASADGSPVCNITLLLPTGARHPYKIDEKYLSKRSVEVPETNEAGLKDPFSISVYKLKELILREWRDEWDGKPASPSSIRLIHFGKLLDDKEQLKKYQFSRESPNVVHMSVKPAEMLEEDDGTKGKGSGKDGRGSNSGGGCCVIL